MKTGVSFDIVSRGCSVVHTASMDRIASRRGKHPYAAVRRTYSNEKGPLNEREEFIGAYDTRQEAANACLLAWSCEPSSDGKTVHLPKSWRWATVQDRAVAYGALRVAPKANNGILAWPADQEAVALLEITYHPSDDTFSGWNLRSVPEWTQR